MYNKEQCIVRYYLALSQRDGLEADDLLLHGELDQPGHGVGAGRQDEDERRAAVAVVVGLLQVEGRRLDVLLAHLGDHVLLDQRDQLVRTDAPGSGMEQGLVSLQGALPPVLIVARL